MTTAEALAVVREALEPRTGETLYADHPKVRGLAALALIEQEMERLEPLRSRHAQLIEEANTESLNAAGYRTEVARLLERCAELEAALRAYEDDSLTEDEFRAIARRALGGGE